MKSSGPVFTRQNPFPPASTGRRAHYHPSRNQAITKKEKKTTLSPVRSKQRPSPHSHTRLDKERDRHFPATDGQPVYDESWPSTDSNPASSGMEAPKRPGTATSAPGVQQDSVLAKYIERFRHGRPQSREERQQMSSAIGEEGQEPFWWVSDSSLPASSTPTKTTDKDDHDPAIYSPARRHQRDRSLSPCRGSLSILSDASQAEFDDTETLHLQERANRLLLRGEYTLSDGSIPVSSEGLGGSDFSSPVTADEPARRPVVTSLLKPSLGKVSSDPVRAVTVPPTRPEEDILFQWRLRRKMEQAREWPRTLQPSSLHGSTFSWQPPILSHPSSGGQAHKQQQRMQPSSSQSVTHPHITAPPQETHRLCPPVPDPAPSPAYVFSGPSVSHPQAMAHVPAHMHLLCDVLPCPIQSSRAGAQQSISQGLNESQTKVVHEKPQVPPASSADPFTDAPSPPPALSGALGQEWPSRQTIPERNKTRKADTKESDKNEKKTAVRQQKKSTRTSSHQRLPKKVTPWREQLRQEGNQEAASERCSGDREPPPPSPIHSALGQVVSEVLFPTADPSPAQRIPAPRVSPPHAASAPPQSPAPPCNAQNSVEVISQLLQEAEDSDEREFEDDPLLQVLRKQRKWVKEQISEVDSVLNEFPEEE